jgi:hypothetical protein
VPRASWTLRRRKVVRLSKSVLRGESLDDGIANENDGNPVDRRPTGRETTQRHDTSASCQNRPGAGATSTSSTS